MPVKLDPVETPFLRPAQMAEWCGVDLRTVLKGVRTGAIPCTKLGRAFLIPTAWVLKEAHLVEPEDVEAS